MLFFVAPIAEESTLGLMNEGMRTGQTCEVAIFKMFSYGMQWKQSTSLVGKLIIALTQVISHRSLGQHSNTVLVYPFALGRHKGAPSVPRSACGLLNHFTCYF